MVLHLLESSSLLLAYLYFAGPVVMNMQGFTGKGFKRKLAVQALFGKIYYLSEVMSLETLHYFNMYDDLNTKPTNMHTVFRLCNGFL